METTDKMDICRKVVNVCRKTLYVCVGVAAVNVIVAGFFNMYDKGATDAIHDFYIMTRGGKYDDAVDEMERRAKNK